MTFDPWRWQPHPEVWLLIAGIVGLALYAVRVIGPKVVRDGSPIVTRRQKAWFVTAILLLWVSADWPVHDTAEEGLLVVHMVQHLLMSMIVAPLFLLATPPWLARLIVSGPLAGRGLRALFKPLVAGLVFNAVFVATHWPALVNLSIDVALVHYLVHTALFMSALMMWLPVCGPLPELRLSLPGQMLYLFLQSIVPTVPSAWLIFAENPIYSSYEHAYQLWGVGPVTDQQAAGVLMKLGAGAFLWMVILSLFFKWAHRHEAADRAGVLVTERDVLTWDDVRDELDRLDRLGVPAPTEQS
ncbi:MAG: cytochrome c oxidase assembly protein [Acidimicrobiia bacterium]